MSRILASAGGIGFAPVASGTVASAVAALAGLGLLRLSPGALAAAAALATVGGLTALRRLAHGVVDQDPGWIVIDEVAGQWVAMLGLIGWRHAGWGAVAAFALFRTLDIAKPGPIGWIDRRHGPLPVMADDVLAGALSAVVLAAWRLV